MQADEEEEAGDKHWNPAGGTFLTLGSTTPCREMILRPRQFKEEAHTESPYVPLPTERSRGRGQMVTWSTKAQRAEDAITMPVSREKEGRTLPREETVGWPQESGTS